MTMMAAILTVDDERVVQVLEEACQTLDTADGELVLDFSSVARLQPAAISALQTLAAMADQKAVKLVCRGVKVSVYRVLKLVKLAQRLSFIG